jgi:peptidoglycan/xylan/chitin deacetylase (PgdA/CDA1 family)
MPEQLPVRLAVDSPRARYALSVLLGLLRLEPRDAGSSEPAVLAYGEADAPVRIPAGPQRDWDRPDPALTHVDGVPVVHLPNGAPDDLLYSTYACLTAPWERVDARNEVGTPQGAGGWLDRNGLLEEPLVHRYAKALGEKLASARVAIAAPTPALVLTHDVDEHFSHIFGVREALTRLRRDLGERKPAAARRAAGLARRFLRRHRLDPNDRWDEWRALLRSWDAPATFFVASYNFFDRGAARFDVAYDARNHEVVTELLSLVDAGADIGIHLSLQARQSEDQVRREKERLEEALGLDICSARHHWWALGERPWRTLRFQASAGIKVDCSFGFNDRAGFRRGIAAPFPPFDPETEKPLPLAAVPTIAMDRAVATSPDGAATLERLLETCRAVGGALVLDWHAHVLNPSRMPGARDRLLEIVTRAAERSVPVRTPVELAAEIYDPNH